MIVRVVMSKVTRVPETSFSLSTFVRTPTTYLGPLLALTMTTRQKRLGALSLKDVHKPIQNKTKKLLLHKKECHDQQASNHHPLFSEIEKTLSSKTA